MQFRQIISATTRKGQTAKQWIYKSDTSPGANTFLFGLTALSMPISDAMQKLANE